ncbi:MAG: hypothetical protein WCK59_00235 [Candidatus Falkowbacteria bacterium]
MKKISNLTKYTISFIFLSVFLWTTPLFASSLKDGFSATGNLDKFAQEANYSVPQTPEYYVGLFLNGLFSLLGIITMGLIFYSGFVWMTARGNEAKVTKAKDNLTDALLGLLFIVGGYALTYFILKIFT